MEVLPGFEFPGCQGKVCKLNRAMYRLKQAPRAWYAQIDSHLTAKGLSKSTIDPNLYFSYIDGKYTIVLLYVDDLLVTGDNTEEIACITKDLLSEFGMTSLGRARVYLGAEIEYHNFGIWLHQ
jgi:hypothetical protein